MFRTRITLFRIAGIAIRVDASWIILLALVTWSLGGNYFPAQYAGLPASLYWTMGVIGAFGLFASVLFHELSHAVVARRNGVAMNGITLFIFVGVVGVIMGDFLGGMWSFLIGSFLRNAASMSYQQVVLREALRGSTVRRFMKSEVVTVPREISVEDLVENYFYKHHYRMFPVVSDGRLTGCVSIAEVSQLPREEWGQQSAGAIATRCTTDNTITADTDAVDALARMHRTGTSQ